MIDPHISPREIGRIPALTMKIPSHLPVRLFAALMARAGFRVRWIRRGKVDRAPS